MFRLHWTKLKFVGSLLMHLKRYVADNYVAMSAHCDFMQAVIPWTMED